MAFERNGCIWTHSATANPYQSFFCDIKHKNGIFNAKSDALSRLTDIYMVVDVEDDNIPCFSGEEGEEE